MRNNTNVVQCFGIYRISHINTYSMTFAQRIDIEERVTISRINSRISNSNMQTYLFSVSMILQDGISPLFTKKHVSHVQGQLLDSYTLLDDFTEKTAIR